jgi:hypothetical protein
VFDQPYLPRTFPFLQLLFTKNGGSHIPVNFKIHKLMDSVNFRKTIEKPGFVLPNTFWEIACNTDIQNTIWLARKDINYRSLIHRLKIPLGFSAYLYSTTIKKVRPAKDTQAWRMSMVTPACFWQGGPARYTQA